MHFTRMGGYAQADVPIIVRGDGCYLEDTNGQALPRRARGPLLGQHRVRRTGRRSARPRSSRCASCRSTRTGRTRTHGRSSSQARSRRSHPGDLNRVFFVSGGSEAVESAWKLARQYYMARGEKRLLGSRTSPSGDTTRSWPRPARRGATRRSPGIWRTTARLSARSPSTASRRCESRSSRSSPRCGTSRTQTGTTGRRRKPRRSSPGSSSTSSSRRSSPWGRDGVPRAHGAGAERRRCFTPPAGLLAGRAGAVRRVRHPALGRRGDHCVRPARALVRLRALRHPAGHRHLREGPVVLVRGDRRGDRHRPRDGAVPRVDVDVVARDHLRRPPGDVRHRAEEHRDHEARGDRRARARERRTSSAPSSRRCSTCRSSATCAAPASSTRSSSSRTRRRVRRSTTTSARRCCAASSRRRCSRPASSAAPTTAATRCPDLAAARRGEAEMDEIVGILGDVLAEAGRRMGV